MSAHLEQLLLDFAIAFAVYYALLILVKLLWGEYTGRRDARRMRERLAKDPLILLLKKALEAAKS